MDDITKKRIEKFEDYIENNSLDIAINKIISEHDKKGYDIKKLSNKLNFILSYLNNKSKIK